MAKWLTARGHASFRFVVSEQSQRGLFNKGLLFNVGALAALSQGCQHLVLHDVDQLPVHAQNDYFYDKHPTHLCTWSTQFWTTQNGRPVNESSPEKTDRFRDHVGGALMMSWRDYVAVNGYSNEYWRWGLEDDDMYHRIRAVRRLECMQQHA